MDFAKFLRTKRTVEIHNTMMRFHSQIYFVVKTFFFAYLGVMITFDDPSVILPGILLSLVLLIVRCLVVPVVSARRKSLLTNTAILATMMPRGLSSAVVAEIVASSAIVHARLYPEIVMVVIVSTVVIASLGIPLFARKSPQRDSEARGTSGASNVP